MSGTVTSGNGHPVLDVGSPQLVVLPILGAPVARVAAEVLAAFLARYAAEVEPIQRGQSHGYSRRRIAGSTRWSNHASGTAVDLNAVDHPQHQVTFTGVRRAAMHRLLADFPQLVWGGDWAARYLDEMHVEVAADAVLRLPGWHRATANLNGRTSPTTTRSNVRTVVAAGRRLEIVRFVRAEGRDWGVTAKQTYLAAEYLERETP